MPWLIIILNTTHTEKEDDANYPTTWQENRNRPYLSTRVGYDKVTPQVPTLFPIWPHLHMFLISTKKIYVRFLCGWFASIPIPSLSPFPSFGFLPSVGFGRSYKSHKCYTCGWCVMCTSDSGMCGPPPVEMESDLAIIEFSWPKSVRMPKGGYVLTTLFFCFCKYYNISVPDDKDEGVSCIWGGVHCTLKRASGPHILSSSNMIAQLWEIDVMWGSFNNAHGMMILIWLISGWVLYYNEVFN